MTLSTKRSTLPRVFRRGAVAKTDQRRRDIRAYVERLRQLQADQGGQSVMTVTVSSIAERYTFVEADVMRQETAALEGKDLDWPRYESAVKLLTRLADRLGYVRRAKQLPSALEYAAQFEEASAP